MGKDRGEEVTGSVTLVGAGCGKGLISRQGLGVLRNADVVVYDDLVDTDLLYETKGTCEWVYVGKRFGKHSEKQETIHKVLIEKAREGKAVVRLKGGDGFVFGRGGEEMAALREQDIPARIIPGISSAIAVPEKLGIPVTYRNMAQSVTFITGHTAAEKHEDYEALAKLQGTLVFLMGLHHAPVIAGELMKYGKDKDTPVAILCNGFRAGEKRINGKLKDTAELVKKAETPAVFLVGEVAKLTLTSTMGGPLEGVSVTVTGTKHFTGKLEALLLEKGAYVQNRPVVGIYPDYSRIPEDFSGYGWLAFTSANGIRCFFSCLKERGVDLRSIAHVKFACIGSGTVQMLKSYGFLADFIPQEYTAGAFGEELAKRLGAKGRLLILRAGNGSALLTKALDSFNIAYEDCRVYQARPVSKQVENQKEEAPDYIVFASAFGARTYLEAYGLPDSAKIVCIGEATAAAVQKKGVLLPREHTAEAVVEVILEDYQNGGLPHYHSCRL